VSAAEQERAAVVAWLREQRDLRVQEAELDGLHKRDRAWHLRRAAELSTLADAVERGAHRRTP